MALQLKYEKCLVEEGGSDLWDLLSLKYNPSIPVIPSSFVTGFLKGSTNMHAIIRSLGFATSIRREGLNFGIALILAELFFKFGSFSLEVIGFLATWYVLGWLGDRLRAGVKRNTSREENTS